MRNRPSIKYQPSRQYDLAGIPTRYFNKGEIEALLSLIESVNAESVIEFGVNNGRTPMAVLRNIQTIGLYVGIDVEPGYQTLMPVQRREIPLIPGELALDDDRFELITSKNGSFDLKADEGLLAGYPKFDVAFIDADHSRAGVLNDYNLAQQIVRPGGLIIFHDDNELKVVEVTQTLNELCDQGHKIVHIEGTWLSYEVA